MDRGVHFHLKNLFLKLKNSHFFKIDKFMYIFLACFVTVFIYFNVKDLFSDISIMNEDFIEVYNSRLLNVPSDGILQVFTSNFHSWYILSMFHVLIIRYLPLILNMHPQVCLISVSSFLFFGIFFSLLLALSENFIKYFDNKNFLFLPVLFIFPLVLLITRNSELFWIFISSSWMLSYFFQPVFALLLLNRLEFYYVNQIIPNKKNISIIFTLMFFVAIGHEFFKFVFIFGAFLIFLVDFFVFKSKINLKKSWIFYISFTLLCLINFLLPEYQSFAKVHVLNMEVNNLLPYFLHLISDFKTFIIFKNLFFFLLLAVLFGAVICCIENEKNKRLLIYNLSVLFSSIIFFLTIFYVDFYEGRTIFSHSGLRLLFSIMLINSICSLSGYIIKYIKKKAKINYLWLIILFVSVFAGVFSKGIISNFKEELSGVKDFRKNMYVLEKVYLLNRKKDNTIYTYNFGYISVENYLLNTYKSNLSVNQIKIKPVCENSDDTIACRNNMLKIAKEKLNYNFSEEEIEKADFKTLYEL